VKSTGTPPVAFFVFKRPNLTQGVFEAIRQARPRQLFVIADGPRNPDDQILCNQTRAVIDQVDWPCEVITNFSATNLGLRCRLTSGITWVFDHVEEAIFLEDDCLPHPTFFPYCAELLERYRTDTRVMHISGDCFVNISPPTHSYYFTRYAHVWGWASWRRAWKVYDGALAGWNDKNVRQGVLQQATSTGERQFWKSTLDAVQQGSIDTWDYQWTFSLLSKSGLAINPTVNLVRNIGFGGSATNTTDSESNLADLSVVAMKFPLIHPPAVKCPNFKLDKSTARLFFTQEGSVRKTVRTISRKLRGLFLTKS
jgi:hypothetical protein